MLTARLAAGTAASLIAATALAAPAAADTLPHGAYPHLAADILKAQTLSTGRGVTVAVISTGVDPSDPGLSGKVTTGPDYAFKPAISLSHEYGTSAASIIAARGPSGPAPRTARGVAPGARILSIRAYPQSDESGSSSFLTSADMSDLNAEAIDYAVRHGAQVIYVQTDTRSFPTPSLSSAVQFAVDKKVVIVAAAFAVSKGGTGDVYPPDLPGVIGVGSVRLAGGPAPYSTVTSVRDNGILIAGPGNTFYDSAGYGIDGPGAAAAIVAGTVALIKSRYPGMTVPQVELALARSARYHPRGGYDTTIGFGLVDPYDALRAAAAIVRSPAAAPAGVPLSARLAPGHAPGIIDAVHRSGIKIVAAAVAIVAGLALLVAALLVARRRPSATTAS